MIDYSTLHLDTNPSKGTALVLHFIHSRVSNNGQSSVMSVKRPLVCS